MPPPSHPIIPLLAAFLLAGCAAAPGGQVAQAVTRPGAEPGIADPYEARNRAIFNANLRLDRALGGGDGADGAGAAARVPTPLIAGVSNLADLLSTPRSVLNDVLQGRIEDAGHNAFRFALNATLGVGVFDPATSFGLEERASDFGQTLAVWGVGEGPYLVMPLIGPATSRDVAGFFGGAAIDPLNATLGAPGLAAVWTVRALETATDRLVYSGTIDGILYDSADPYGQARLIYLEKRRSEIREADDALDYFDPYEDTE